MSQQSGEMSATYGPTMLRYVAIVWSGLKDDDWEFQGGGVQKTRVPLKKTCKSSAISIRGNTVGTKPNLVPWRRWYSLEEMAFSL